MSEEGTIELQINQVAEFVRDEDPKTQQRLSAPTYIYDLPWKILARIQSSTKNDVNRKTLGFFAQCNAEDDLNDSNWSCQASVKLHIVSQKAGVGDRVRVCDHHHNFTAKENDWGYKTFISCDELLNPNNGWIKNDVLILRAYVNAEMPQRPQMLKLRAFASSISDAPDGTLIVGTNRIPIHKMYLSYYSEYFKTMFRSEFKEGHEDEIVIEEVEYKEILQLLSFIYPASAPITDKNIKVILKLADRFIMPAVLERCHNVLRTSTLGSAKKLLLAQQYNFKDLQKEFAQQCKTVEDAKKLKAEPEYKMLDSDMRALILDNITF